METLRKFSVKELQAVRLTDESGFSLIASEPAPPDNPGMQEAQLNARDAKTPEVRIQQLRREIDARDETIRLLNEALSQALEELERLEPRQAA